LSGSAKGMSAHLIKTAVGAVLQTLTPNDFFSGIWYNSRRERVLDNCTGTYDSFVQATSGNKVRMCTYTFGKIKDILGLAIEFG